jgi:hypothetical protein
MPMQLFHSTSYSVEQEVNSLCMNLSVFNGCSNFHVLHTMLAPSSVDGGFSAIYFYGGFAGGRYIMHF